MAEEKKEDFTQHSEYKNINTVVSRIFEDKILSKDERKILFSKHIEDWKKKNNNNEPTDEKLKLFICNDIKKRYKDAIDEIKKQFPGGQFKESKATDLCISIPPYAPSSNDMNIKTCCFEFLPYLGSIDGKSIRMKPKILRFCENGDENITSIVTKSFLENGTISVSEGFDSPFCQDKDDLLTRHDCHSVELSFEKDKILLKTFFT